MSSLQLPTSFINNVLQMGFPSSAIELAQRTTNSNDLNILLEWILTHENEIDMNNTKESNETYLANQVIRKVTELGFSKSSVELAQRKTKSNDAQTLVEWILKHDPSEEHRSVPSITTDRLATTTTTEKQEINRIIDNTLLNDLLKLGFEANDIETCFDVLNIDLTKKFNIKNKRIECVNWLIDNSQKNAQSKAKQVDRSRKQLRVPVPIKLNNYQYTDLATTPQIITNNFLKQMHLSSRHETTDDVEQQPSLTPEEARIADIHDNLKKQSWTIYNLDQLNLIQKHIKIVAKIIDEDHHNIQRYHDDDNDEDEIQPIRPTTARQSNIDQTKKIVTLADLAIRDRIEYKSDLSKALAAPPRKIHVPGALEEANWDPSLLKELDRVAVELKYRRGENYQQLADRLIEQCRISPDDERSKIRAIFVWITSHIRYDINMSPRDNENKNKGHMDDLCHMILQTSSCVCVGYAVLFQCMCQHFNIRVDYVRGYTKLTKSCKNDTPDADNLTKLSGHAWTIVHHNGKTYFTDPTWSAATWSSPNELKSPFTNTYFLVLPKYSIYQFRPDKDCDQHINSPWTIQQFCREPCFYPHYFRSAFSLEDRDTEWCYYRLRIERDKQKSMIKSFRITTRTDKSNSTYPMRICGFMYWTNDLSALTEDLSRLENTKYEHKLEAVEFQRIDLTNATNRLKNKKPLFIGELNDIPIYPPKLNVNEIQYGLLKIYATDQSNRHYEPIFECIFEFH